MRKDSDVGVKKIKISFYLSTVFMCLMSLSFILMPIASDKASDGDRWWLLLSGALFWISFIAGYILLWLANHLRKKIKSKSRKSIGMKSWGIINFSTNFKGIFIDAVLVVGVAGFIIFQTLIRGRYESYIFLSIAVLGLHLHGLLNGANYKFINETNKAGTRQTPAKR